MDRVLTGLNLLHHVAEIQGDHNSPQIRRRRRRRVSGQGSGQSSVSLGDLEEIRLGQGVVLTAPRLDTESEDEESVTSDESDDNDSVTSEDFENVIRELNNSPWVKKLSEKMKKDYDKKVRRGTESKSSFLMRYICRIPQYCSGMAPYVLWIFAGVIVGILVYIMVAHYACIFEVARQLVTVMLPLWETITSTIGTWFFWLYEKMPAMGPMLYGSCREGVTSNHVHHLNINQMNGDFFAMHSA